MLNKRSKKEENAFIKKPSVVKLTINVPQEEVFAAPSSLSEYVNIPIPKTKHLLSLYFLSISEMLEFMWNNGIPFEAGVIGLLIHKLKEYIHSPDNRKNIEDSLHKSSVWIVRCRLKLIEYLQLDPENKERVKGFSKRWPILDAFNLIGDEGPIFDYSIEQLVLALEVFGSNMNKMVFTHEFESYFESLFVCCAKYIFVDGKNQDLYNMPKYVEKLPNEEYRVTKQFVVDTERIFFDFEHRILIARSFLNQSCSEEELFYIADKYPPSLFKFLAEYAEPAHDILKKSIKDDIFESCIRPGDREIFKETFPTNSETPFNIVSKLQDDLAKDIYDMVYGNFYTVVFDVISKNFLSYIKKERKVEENPNIKESEIDRIKRLNTYHFIPETAMQWFCRYFYEGKTASRDGLSVFIFHNWDLTYPLKSNTFYINEIPALVQYSSEWGVWDPGRRKIHCYPTFVQCFFVWISIMIHMPNFTRRILSIRKNGLDDIYTEIEKRAEINQ